MQRIIQYWFIFKWLDPTSHEPWTDESCYIGRKASIKWFLHWHPPSNVAGKGSLKLFSINWAGLSDTFHFFQKITETRQVILRRKFPLKPGLCSCTFINRWNWILLITLRRRCHWDAPFFESSHVLSLSPGQLVAVLPVSIGSPWRSATRCNADHLISWNGIFEKIITDFTTEDNFIKLLNLNQD